MGVTSISVYICACGILGDFQLISGVVVGLFLLYISFVAHACCTGPSCELKCQVYKTYGLLMTNKYAASLNMLELDMSECLNDLSAVYIKLGL